MPIKPTVNNEGYYEVEPTVFSSNDRFVLDSIVAYEARLQAFANGAMYVLLSDSSVDNSAKIEEIKALTHKRITAANYLHLKDNPPNIKVWRTELDRFNKELEQASGLTRKNIALGEAFWAWQVYDRPEKRVTKSVINELEVIQVETLLHNPLTLEQKNDLLKIHNPDRDTQPDWFKKMPVWAQTGFKKMPVWVQTRLKIHNPDLNTQPDWFKKMPVWAQTRLKSIIPENASGDWVEYEKTIPATLRHLPGEANATKHELFINNVLCGTAYKQGVPTPYDMPLSDQQDHATNNIQQMLVAREQDRVNAFKQYWGLTDDSLNKDCPVLLCGLLTPMQQGGALTVVIDGLGLSKKENNTRFVQQKTTGLDAIKSSNPENTIQYFDLNVPINNLAASTPVSIDKNYLAHANQLYESLAGSIQVNPDLAIDSKREKLRASIDALKEHDGLAKMDGRNKNLYTAALYDLTTRHMGGVSTGNCKSSKDRKGVELMMADAMEVYYARYHKFPSYTDVGENRQNFLTICAALYESGHQLLIAHDNSPGSPGIKDDDLLDKDLVLALGDFYSKSEAVANNNKPQTLFDKQKDTIQKVTLGFGVILSIVSVALIASGVLAVPGVLVGALAVNLLGATFNLAPVMGVIGSAIATGLAYLGVERFMNKNKYAYHLDNQMDVVPERELSHESSMSSHGDDYSIDSTNAICSALGVLPKSSFKSQDFGECQEDAPLNERRPSQPSPSPSPSPSDNSMTASVEPEEFRPSPN